MEKQEASFFTAKTVGIAAVVTLGWFLFFCWALTPFVPGPDPVVVLIVAAFTAACMTGGFFIAANMFSLVLQDEIRRKRR